MQVPPFPAPSGLPGLMPETHEHSRSGGTRCLTGPLLPVKAYQKIEACFQKAGVKDHQRCRLYDAPHQFNRAMQAEAWAWLGARI